MIFHFISPIGHKSPGLYDSFVDVFINRGHTITDDVAKADCCFFDLHAGFAPYDWTVLNHVLNNRIPVVVMDAHDYYGQKEMRSDWVGFNDWQRLKFLADKDQHWAKFILLAKDRCAPFVYFLRKMQKSWPYPSFVRPFELTLFHDHDFPLVSKEELAFRPHDVCFIGAASPWRSNLIAGLLKDGRLVVDYFFPFIRIPHNEWLKRHCMSKLFLEADAGGFSSERPYQLMTISPMLRVSNDQLIHENWTDGIDCIEVGDVWGTPSKQDIDKIIDALQPDNLYRLYVTGVERLQKHFTDETRANYILDQLATFNIK